MRKITFNTLILWILSGLLFPAGLVAAEKPEEEKKIPVQAAPAAVQSAKVLSDRTELKTIVDGYFIPLIDNDWCAGCSVGVIAGPLKEIFNYGTTGHGEKKVDENTVFEIGSVSKTFTAILLQEMADRNEVALDDTLAACLPEGVNLPKDKNGKTFTLRQLADQTSGLPLIPDNFAADKITDPYAEYTDKQLYEYLNRCVLPREPGKQYEYSNLGVAVLGEMLARKAGKSYEQLTIERFLKPLAMNNTRIKLTPAMKERFARGHNADGVPVGPWEFEVFAPCGGWRSTGRDMMKFLAANLGQNAGTSGSPDAGSDTGKLLRSIRKTHNPQFKVNEHLATGLGWHIFTGGNLVWHNGGTNGYASFIGFNSEKQIGIVVLANTGTNCAAFGVISEAGIGVLSRLAGKDYTPPTKIRKTVNVPEPVLDAYTGQYTDNKTLTFSVTREKNKLLVHFPGSPPLRLFPESATVFFLKVTDLQITFEKEEKGGISRGVLCENGKKTRFTKLR